MPKATGRWIQRVPSASPCSKRSRALFHRLAVLACVLVSMVGLAARPVHAQTENSGYVIRDLVAALNRGDSVGASVDLASDFVLVLADGTQTTGANARQTLATLATPITVVSLIPTGNMLGY